MKIVFFGTDDFAAANLEALVLAGHRVLACVTAADKARGRGLKVRPCPVKETALQHYLPVLQPATLTDTKTEKQLRSYSCDMFVVIAYGKILPRKVLEIPRLFCINAHASLLPKYRGAAPINWAIINGENETGVSMVRMNETMDAGDVMARAAIPIIEEDTAITLRKRLANLSAECLLETIDRLKKGKVSFAPQNPAEVTYAPKLTKKTGRIVWEKSAVEIDRLARGLLPWPTAYTFCNGKILKVLETSVVATHVPKFGPGQVMDISSEGILVAAGRDSLLLQKVHPESSRVMDGLSFAVGHKIGPGCRLGDL